MRLALLAVLLWVGVQQQQVGWVDPQVTQQTAACTDVLNDSVKFTTGWTFCDLAYLALRRA
jgi:hypothetical protein